MKKMTLALAGAMIALAPPASSAAVRVFVGPPAIGYGFYGPYVRARLLRFLRTL